MKYLSFIALVFVIFLSQFLVKTPEGVSYQTHSSIQSELQSFIKNYIKEHLPQASHFKILNITSERIDAEKTVTKNKVKVNFNYSFRLTDSTVGQTKSELEGFAILSELEDNKWSLDSVQIDGQKLEFDDPVIITPDGDAPANDDSNAEPENDDQMKSDQ